MHTNILAIIRLRSYHFEEALSSDLQTVATLSPLYFQGKERFIPGQTVNGEFVPGQTVTLGAGPDGAPEKVFVAGEVVADAKGKPQFLPGVYNSDGVFTPGVNLETLDGQMFVEGKLHQVNK